MGETFRVDNLEDMCAMMCDNRVPKEKPGWWYMTFGWTQKHAGFYVKIYGTFNEARKKMFDKYGREWSFQYSEDEWKSWVDSCPPELIEKELEVIE